ncbi:intraflagellar transport-associated protein isoform X3 [Phascolarctos cinereus]
MDEDRLIEQALDRFINCHEQTYEEFLNTFTHLSKDHQVIRNRTPGADSSGSSFATGVYPGAQSIRNECLSLHPIAQPPEEEQVDSFLDLEDFDMDEETDHKLGPELLLLPGEVEEEVRFSVSGYVPSFDQHSHSEPKTCSAEQLACRHLKEVPFPEVHSLLSPTGSDAEAWDGVGLIGIARILGLSTFLFLPHHWMDLKVFTFSLCLYGCLQLKLLHQSSSLPFIFNLFISFETFSAVMFFCGTDFHFILTALCCESVWSGHSSIEKTISLPTFSFIWSLFAHYRILQFHQNFAIADLVSSKLFV